MFTDLVDSTRLRTTLGDEAVDQLLDSHHATVHQAVARADGTVVKSTGDGCLAVFSSARSAIAAAAEIRVASDDPVARFRIGLHAGDVRHDSERDGDVLGEAVNAASRITALADGGEILVSQVVRDLAGTIDLDLVEHGTFDLRGFPSPWTLHRVVTIDATIDATGDATRDPSGAASVDVRLLGEITVWSGGRVVDGWSTPRVGRLLARVALAPGGRIDRRRLAFELWPDSTDSQARTNLRKLLHELRAGPGPDDLLVADASTVRFGERVRIDVRDVVDAVDRGDGATVAQRYGGDLLPGCYDDATVADRDRLRLAALAAVETTASTTDDPELVVRLTTALTALDPACESAYRLAMVAHARRGARSEALRVYHRCAEALERELGVTPDEATVAVYESIRADVAAPQLESQPGAPLDEATAAPASTPVIGRDHELARLEDAWSESSLGRAQLVLLVGEPGIGKTRLAAELARRVTACGAAAAATRSYEAAGATPWGPLADWLRSDAYRGRLARLDDVWRRHVARLLPELEAPGSPLGAGAHDRGSRRILLDALVRALAPTTPTLLVLDDIQWCDDDTLELLGHLIHQAATAPLLIIATARPVELEGNAAAGALLAELAHVDRLVEMTIDRLDRTSTSAIASVLTGSDPDQLDADRWWNDTEGNPLFIVELARARHPSRHSSRHSSGHGAGPPTVIPPSVRSVIADRLARLTPGGRDLAEHAAVIGRAFDTSVLAAASGRSDDTVVDELDELWRRQIIREQGAGYDFSHDKIREVLVGSIGPARRRQLHRRVADALEARHADDPRPVGLALAGHREAAGQIDDAITALRWAAEYAVELFALDEAVTHLERALRLLGDTPAGQGRDRTELQLRIGLGAALLHLTGYGSSRTLGIYERAAAACRRLGGPIDPAVLRGLGLAMLVRCEFHRAHDHAATLLEAAGDDVVAQVEGHYLMGVNDCWRGRFASSAHHLTTSLALYRPELVHEHLRRFAQDPRAISLVRLGQVRLWQGAIDDGLALADEARRYADALGHPGTRMYVGIWQAMQAIEMGALDDATAATSLVRSLLDRHGEYAYFLSVERVLQAWVDLLSAREGALREIDAAVTEWRTSEQSLHLTYGLTLLARGHALAGDTRAGHEAVREGLGWAEQRDQHYMDAALWLAEARLHDRDGDATAAHDALEQAAAIARSQGAHFYERATAERLSVTPH